MAAALATPGCGADRTVSDASMDDGVGADGGAGVPDLGQDATLTDTGTLTDDVGTGDQGATADAGNGTGDQGATADAGNGTGDQGAPASGWSQDDMLPGPVGLRVTSSVFADGRAAILYETAVNSNVLRALAWTGAGTGAWTDLGVVNTGLAGSLAPANNLDDLHLQLLHVGSTQLLAVFQQDGGIYSNYYDGAVWGTPVLVEGSLSTVTLAGDGGARALLVYGVGTEVRARYYSAVSHTLGAAQAVADLGADLGLPLGLLSRAAIDTAGNATVFFRAWHMPSNSYRMYGYRRASSDSVFSAELPTVTGLFGADRLCAASNAAGDVVFSFNERFMNQFGTFDRVRHVYRDATTGFGAVSDTSAAGFVANVNSCAISDDGSAVVVVVNGNLVGGPAAVPIQYESGVASTGTALDAPLPVTASRPIGSMAAAGLGGVSFFRTDDRVEVALQSAAGGDFAAAPFLAIPNVINNKLDQLFKASQRLNDGRFLLLYQSGQNHLRYAVLVE